MIGCLIINDKGHLYVGKYQRFWETNADRIKRKSVRLRLFNKMAHKQSLLRRKFAGVSEFDVEGARRAGGKPKAKFLNAFLRSGKDMNIESIKAAGLNTDGGR